MPDRSPKPSTTRSTTLVLLSIAGGIATLWFRTLSNPHTLHLHGYSFWGWFISYDGGFVRRGLGGEIVNLLSRRGPALPVVNALVFAQYTALACLTAGLLILSPRAGNAVRFLMLAAPFSVVAMARTGTLFAEKEMWFHVCLAVAALSLLILETASKLSEPMRKAGRWAVILFSFLAGLVLPLLHEAFLFLSAPAFLILIRAAARRAGERSTRLLTVAFTTVQLTLCGILFCFKGHQQTAERIWASMNLADRALLKHPHIPTAIGYLGWNSADLQHIVVEKVAVRPVWYWVIPLLIWAISVPAIALSAAKDPATRAERLSVWLVTYCFLVALSAPLYVAGADWDRWMPATLMSWAILFLALNPDALRQVLPVRLPQRGAGWLAGLYGYRRWVIAAAVLLDLVAPDARLVAPNGRLSLAEEIRRDARTDAKR